jgi:hypothetical protein
MIKNIWLVIEKKLNQIYLGRNLKHLVTRSMVEIEPLSIGRLKYFWALPKNFE